jgi:hypothetical protein
MIAYTIFVAPVIKFLEASSREPWTEVDIIKKKNTPKDIDIDNGTYGQGIQAK